MALQQQLVSQPPNLPEDRTEPGKTSSTAYLTAPWIPGYVMRTVHMRVLDIAEPYQVCLKCEFGEWERDE